MNSLGWRRPICSPLIPHSKQPHFTCLLSPFLKRNVISTCLVWAWLLLCQIPQPSRDVFYFYPPLLQRATESIAQSCSRLAASFSDMVSPWSQPAVRNELATFLWRAKLKTDAGAGHWRNLNMARMPRRGSVRTGITSKGKAGKKVGENRAQPSLLLTNCPDSLLLAQKTF